MPRKRKTGDPETPRSSLESMPFWSRIRNPPPVLAFAFPELEDMDEDRSLEKLLNIPDVPYDDSIVYSLKISLDGASPQIWRRVLTKSVNLEVLHEILQIAMGWEDCHLHEFEVRKTRVPSIDESAPVNERGLSIAQLFNAKVMNFWYVYDLGDEWVHAIQIEKMVPAKETVTYPICVAGRGACPFEDCGGVDQWSYFVDAMKHPERMPDRDLGFLQDLLDDGIEPSPFSHDDVTKELHRVFKKPARRKKRS